MFLLDVVNFPLQCLDKFFVPFLGHLLQQSLRRSGLFASFFSMHRILSICFPWTTSVVQKGRRVCSTYVQGQMTGEKLREYFYFIDHQGQVSSSLHSYLILIALMFITQSVFIITCTYILVYIIIA